MKHLLYGDGIHDDHPAIQEMIDSGVCEVILPVPQKHYLISKTLVLPSNFKLVLPRFAEIKLADGANCLMVQNKMTPDYAERLPKGLSRRARSAWYYVNEYSPEALTQNIEIQGGIWNFNNMNQRENPDQSKIPEPYGYTGEGMIFYGVKNMKISSMTLNDPVHFGILLDRVSYFTVEDITFDYNDGNPLKINMDGIHLNGHCHHGMIRNLKGACYDDLVALNANEGSCGPITNIEIDGLFAEVCHSAVRLLTVSEIIENVHISNVYGTYYQYCIGFTKFYSGTTTGIFKNVSVNHVYASKASREGIYPWPDSYVFPFIYFQEDIKAKNIRITDVYRSEHEVPVETIYIGEEAEVENLIIDHIVTENYTGKKMPLLVNHSMASDITLKNVRQKKKRK